MDLASRRAAGDLKWRLWNRDLQRGMRPVRETADVLIWSGERLGLGEGPLSHHLRSSLLWCDIIGRSLYEKPFDGGETHRFELTVMPSAAGIVDERRILLATEIDLRVLDLDSGEVETVARFPEDRDMRSNDGRTHPSGAFWVGTMAKDGGGKPGAIYRCFEGALGKEIDDVVVPNSICFSDDGRFAYFADSPKRTIWRIPTDPGTGQVTGGRSVFASLDDETPGVPDGSAIDDDGNLWNCRWGGSAVDVYDRNGERVRSYPVPVTQPTCPAFVGGKLDQVVITSATVGLRDSEMSRSDGAVLQVLVPVSGRPECRVKL